MARILGIETTAHTFGAGVVSYRPGRVRQSLKVLSNVRDPYTTEEGGMIPARVADHHVEVCGAVISRALAEAKATLSDIDAIAVSQGPGIGHTLRIGIFAARTLSLAHRLPLVGVNHCIAHLEIGRLLTKARDPILLYVSGANTQVIAYEAGLYRIFGETLDIGIGNFLDTFARSLNLGFPGGPKIAALAAKGRNFVPLPYTVKGMDVSFGGLLTHVKGLSGKVPLEDLCFSVQETAFAMLLEVAERAMAHTGKTELLLGGGVACNRRLQEMARMMVKARKAKAYILPDGYNVDNGAMIAATGALLFDAKAGKPSGRGPLLARPYERTDDVPVFWR